MSSATAQPSSQRSFARNVAGAAGAYLLSPVVGVATAPVLAHSLGVTGRGHFAATTSPTLLLTIAATLGLPEAITHFVASGQRLPAPTLQRAAGQTLAISVLMVAGIVLIAPTISGHNHDVASIMRIGALALPPALLVGVVRGAAAGRHEWRLVNLERGGGNVLRLVFVVLVATVLHLTLLSATLIYLLSPVLSGAIYIPLLVRMYRKRGFEPIYRLIPDPVLTYGLQVWAGGMAGIVLDRLDQVLMTPLSNPYQLGLYAAAVAVAEVPFVVAGATRDVVLASDSQNANDELAVQACRLTFAVVVVFAAGLAAAAWPLIHLAYGSAFSQAVPILLILLGASVLYTPGMTSGGVLLSRGSALQRSLAMLAACVTNVGMIFILVPVAGGIGAAIASVAAYAVYSAINLFLMRRICGTSIRELLIPTREDLTQLAARIAALQSRLRAG